MDFLKGINWLELVALVVPVVITILAGIITKALNAWLKAKGNEKHRDLIVWLAEMAYWVVEQIARRTPGNIDDKLADALKYIAEQLGRDMTTAERNIATSAIKALHEKRKATSLSLAENHANRTQLGTPV